MINTAAIGMVTMESSGASPYKKATAALDEAARARLRGPFVIGDVAPSPAPPSRRADADDDLMDLVDEFYNGYGEPGTDDGGVAKDAVARRRTNEWKETLRLTLVDAAADAAAARILAEAERVVQTAGPAIVAGGEIRKRLVERLRARGFDAGKSSTAGVQFSIAFLFPNSNHFVRRSTH